MRTSVLLLFATLGVAAQAAEQPNIVIFMVDDLGWNHIGVEQATMGTHGEQYATPHLDRLAKEGLSFTHAYAQSNCAPTRAVMLSGQYAARIHNDVYNVGNLNRRNQLQMRFGQLGRSLNHSNTAAWLFWGQNESARLHPRGRHRPAHRGRA